MRRVTFLIISLLFVAVQFGYSQQEKADVIAAAEKGKKSEEIVDTLQKDGNWKFGGNFQLALNQFFASNWVGAGDPYVGIGTLDRLFLTYNKNRFAWRTTLDFDFGTRYVFKPDTVHNEKTADKIELNSQIGYKVGGNWYATLLLNAYTQIANGYTNDTVKTSAFMTPGVVMLSLGMENKQKAWSWYISPIAGKLTTKLDSGFYEQKIAGVDSGKRVLASLGAFTRLMYSADIHPKVNLNARLELFYNYLGEYAYMRNLSTNFEMIWNFAITNWLSVSLKTGVAYDYTTKFSVFNEAGNKTGETDHVQFQESFGLVLGYKFKIPKK